MPHLAALLGFALVSFGLVLTPGPNMIYLISRSLTQGPAAGSVLVQSLLLGSIQIVISVSVSVNAMIALAAGSIASFLGTRPNWLLVQRWLMGTVLAGLAVRMALETRKA